MDIERGAATGRRRLIPRAESNDFAELFGYAPDDTSPSALRQWKSQGCPFVGGACIKNINLPDSGRVVSGACSVANKLRSGRTEEVIICLQRLYADGYKSLRSCAYDAIGSEPPILIAKEYSEHKKSETLPDEYIVILGQRSGSEISLRNSAAQISIDWVMAYVVAGNLNLIIPCEVQSIDTTGNYRDAWRAYANEESEIPNSNHGMNWANVWKRLIPQLMLKGAVASTSTLCTKGLYFVVPDRVYTQFEKLVGELPEADEPDQGVLTVMTYELGSEAPEGAMRPLVRSRTIRTLATDFAESFASGKELLPLGSQLDEKVNAMLSRL